MKMTGLRTENAPELKTTAMKNLRNYSSVQINPLLYFVESQGQEGWINERFVNLLIYDGVVDYVDNVNYSGLFHHIANYTLRELDDFIEKAKTAVRLDQFGILWVDEYYLSSSYRHNLRHFVHPLIIYGYNEEIDAFNVIFFDIMKGHIFVCIDSKELSEAVKGVKEHYLQGGTEEAAEKTLSVFKLHPLFKGAFHLDVFIRNLSQYLYCTKDPGAEWYNTQREQLFNNRNVVYGVQVYRVLIDELRSPERRINYKSLHDFVKHKKFLYEKLVYIEREYEAGQPLKHLIEQFGRHADELESIRLLNIKYQTVSGGFPASLSFNGDYIKKLLIALERGYDKELDLLPRILQGLSALQYTKNCFSENHVLSYEIKTREIKNGYYCGCVMIDPPVYSNRIDTAGSAKQVCSDGGILVLNDRYRYLIKRNFENRRGIISVDIPVTRIQKIEFMSLRPDKFTINVFCLPGQDLSAAAFDPGLLRGFEGVNQMKFKGCDGREMQFVFTGGDPYIFGTGYAINASYYRYICVEMKSAGTSKKAQLFFSEVGSRIFSPQRMVEFDIVPDGLFHTYVVDMRACRNWTGAIGGLRLDPAHYDADCPRSEELPGGCTIRELYLDSGISGREEETFK